MKASLEADTRVAPERQMLYLFSGFVKCGFCGGNMTRKTIPVKGKKYVYLVCMENKNKTGCKNNKSISLLTFETVILKVINLHIEKVFELDQMRKIAGEIPYNSYLLQKIQDTITDKEAEIQRKRQYSTDVYQDYKNGIVTKDEYLELKITFNEEINTLKNQIEALQEEAEKIIKDNNDKVQWVDQFIRYRGFQELSRELLLRLVEEIRVYDKDRIEVIFKFHSEYEKMCCYITETAKTMEGGDANGKEKPEKYQQG